MKVMSPNVVLAVLPFRKEQLQENPVIEHFEEDLIYHLSKFNGLSILSFFSTSQWSMQDADVIHGANVSHIITGSFRSIAGKVVINVQLVEMSQHKVIYDQRVDFRNDAIFDLFDQSVLQVTNLLQTQLNNSILSASYQKPKVDLQTYELLLVGNSLLKEGTPASDLKARSFFEEALKQQPNYARAYAGISGSYFNQWSCQMWDRWEISQSGAKKYALKAIEHDENDYQALFILGRVLLFERDFDQAEFYLRKSIEMNHNDSSTLLEIAFSMMFLGELDEAQQHYERACYLNPLKEHKYLAVGATLAFESGDFEKAISLGKRLEITTTYIDFPVYMAAAYYYAGDEEKAMEYWKCYLKKFDEHIYFHDRTSRQDPLLWQINVNPYRGTTHLTPFHEFLSNKGEGKLTDVKTTADSNATFMVVGNMVHFVYQGKSCVLSKTKGLDDIMKLLSRPHQDIHCLELMQTGNPQVEGVTIIDTQSKKEYQQRIQSLQLELQEAELLNDTAQVEKISTEYDQLLLHLSQSLGIKGEGRKVGSSAEKARSAVTGRIRDSIRKVKLEHEPLGMHLSNSIKTGLLCAYRPEKPVRWDDLGD